MPAYIFRCYKCGDVDEKWLRIGEANFSYECSCGGLKRRSYAEEGVISTFHPTNDLYAKSKRSNK